MKPTRLAIAALVFASATAFSAAHAQRGKAFTQGRILIDGHASLSRSHTDGSDNDPFVISIAPSALFFLNGHIAVGGSVLAGLVNSDLNKSDQLGIGPAVRYYFSDKAGNVRPYVNVAVLFTHTNQTLETIPEQKSTQDAITGDGALGLTFVLNDHVGLLSEAFVTRQTGSNKTNAKAQFGSTNYGLRFGFDIFL